MSYTKSYQWDHACIAFGNPFDLIEKREKKNEKSKSKPKKLTGSSNRSKNYHLKHG